MSWRLKNCINMGAIRCCGVIYSVKLSKDNQIVNKVVE